MVYKRIFTNSYLQISLHTNSKRINTLVENFLDFNNKDGQKRPKIKACFYLNEGNVSSRCRKTNHVYRGQFIDDEIRMASFGKSVVRVKANYSSATVTGVISRFDESVKERILQYAFTVPLQRILSNHGFFFLHASIVCRKNNYIIIIGPARSGKSTLALLLSQYGFNPLSDDDCFVKLTGTSAYLFPFPTKIGLNEKLLKYYPKIAGYTIKDYRYYNKQRISLSAFKRQDKRSGYKCKAIIFPKYKARKRLSINAVSKKKTLELMLKYSLLYLYRDKEQNVLWTFYALAQKTRSFQLVYNNDSFNEIPIVIRDIIQR